jgi:fluoride exporter
VRTLLYIFVGIGGAIGSAFRYLLSYFTFNFTNSFPVGTLLVNLIGAFLLGWFVARIWPLNTISLEIKKGLSTGIIGSFTTFSTLSVEVIALINEKEFVWLIVYLILSIFGGMALIAFGHMFGQKQGIGRGNS